MNSKIKVSKFLLFCCFCMVGCKDKHSFIGKEQYYVNRIGHLILEYQKINDEFPLTSGGINSLTLIGKDGVRLLEVVDEYDSWGEKYIYRFPSQCNMPFDFYSKGPNKKDECGHGDDIAFDLINSQTRHRNQTDNSKLSA